MVHGKAIGCLIAAAVLAGQFSAQAQETITGKITDAVGSPLAGVQVRVLASDRYDTTDAQGRYELGPTPISVRPGVRRSAARDIPFFLSASSGSSQAAGVRDLLGRHLSEYRSLAAGAYVLRPGAPAPEATHPAAPAKRAASAFVPAAPAAWVQAYLPGHTVASRRAPIGGGTLDLSLSPSTGVDFGPNVLVFDTTMPMADIQSQLDTIANRQARAQFGTDRYALVFMPGSYNLDVNVHYYTQVLGAGRFPGEVTINGSVGSKMGHGTGGTNVTLQFWRGVENLTINPTSITKSANWAVSQGTVFRRNHVKGGLNLSIGGWASGGYIADSRIDGTVQSGSQQQWFSRNTQWNAWSGGVWNMFFLGVSNPPAGTWPTQPYTVVPTTPAVREKPYIFMHQVAKTWAIHVGALRKDEGNTSWDPLKVNGYTVDFEDFAIVRPGKDNAAVLNEALRKHRGVIFTPGIYHLEAPLKVIHPQAVLFGLGFATLVPDSGTAALEIADVNEVTVSGLVIDAGPKESPVLVRVGEPGSSKSHAAAPTVLHDLFLRVGGPREGSAAVSVEVNSADVILDHAWIWRADHGAGARWDMNKGKTGLVVKGKDVTAYGLFVEHYQEYQTVWEGEGGRTYFYQCEMPYDPPSQDLWQHDGIKGWAGYKVAPGVQIHTAMGMGVYTAFKQAVVSDHAVEAPSAPGVKLGHIVAIWLNGAEGSGINNVLNAAGGAVSKSRTKATID